jgi:O-antigen ligase
MSTFAIDEQQHAELGSRSARQLSKSSSPGTKKSWLLVASLTFSAATQARFGPAGFGELLGLLYIGLSLPYRMVDGPNRSVRRLVTTVISVIFICVVMGMFVSTITERPGDGVGREFITLSYCFLLTFTVMRHELVAKDAALNLLKRLLISMTVVFGTVALVAQFTSSFAGFTFWYEGSTRFRGIAKNPNQIPTFLLWTPFASFYFFRRRFFVLPLVALQVWIGLLSRSDGFQLAVLVGAGATLMSFTVSDVMVRGRTGGLFLAVGGLLIMAVGANAGWSTLERRVEEASEGGGNGRQELFRSAVELIPESPIFGFGPGGWVRGPTGAFFEAHNNYLDLTLRAGLVGTLVLIAFQVTILMRALRRNPPLFGALAAIATYGLTGFQLRWPIHWAVWCSIAVIVSHSSMKPESG